ncbi:hypothetical protein KP509_29G040000 [Ceratopteris richardii]|uniref:Uncharacterized protein n=1 Tax=Ceratopteris richardii TaxID=49495 RepID=A0A8T2R7Z3_CERRI|nr:hypothetical protein KP509_29G040000 [Ceratopteris richardii]
MPCDWLLHHSFGGTNPKKHRPPEIPQKRQVQVARQAEWNLRGLFFLWFHQLRSSSPPAYTSPSVQRKYRGKVLYMIPKRKVQAFFKQYTFRGERET